MAKEEKLFLNKTPFIHAAYEMDQIPSESGMEIAFIGRSNVGKSSLINHLTRTQIAHVSTNPGKTRGIHFFSCYPNLTLVDLPGYGFAKVSREIRAKWGDLIQNYLLSRKNLVLILFLLDIRHPPSKEDIAFADWIGHHRKKVLLIFTKADVLSLEKQQQKASKTLSLIKASIGDTCLCHILYSIKNTKGRIALLKEIERVIDDTIER